MNYLEYYLKLNKDLHEAERELRLLYGKLKGEKGYLGEEEAAYYLRSHEASFQIMKEMERLLAQMRSGAINKYDTVAVQQGQPAATALSW